MPIRPWKTAVAGFPLLLSALLPMPVAAASPPPVQVILNGQVLALSAAPTIVNDRTLVPLRGVFEAMGAQVEWNGTTRTVEVTRDSRYVRLKIDRRLACLGPDCYAAAVLDVPAQLITERTFVPVRFLSQAMGAHVEWDENRRAVLIDTNREPETVVAPVRITSLTPGQIISGPVGVQVSGPAGTAVQVYAIHPTTGVGRMIAAGSDPTAAYTYTPDPADTGLRLLVAAIRDELGAWRYSDAFTVMMASQPVVEMTGVEEGGLIEGPITFGSDVNFVASQVTFRLIDVATGTAENLGTVGPGDKITWYPQIAHAGNKRIQAVASDRNGMTYESRPVGLRVQSGYRQFVSGIRDGSVITRPVTLSVSANYGIKSVEYLLNGNLLGTGGRYTWNFGPEANGKYTLNVRITGTDGVVRLPDPVNFTVNTSPQVWPAGIGPNQVVTGAVALKATGNIPLQTVVYHLVDENLNGVEVLGSAAPGAEFTWTPAARHAGNRILRVVGVDTQGNLIRSEPVSFRVFLGKVFGPVPVTPKTQFLDLSSRLSIAGYRETGMSAALKTAQSILETGWGQSSPVDKYSGQVSYNLFGIKGTGPAGSVISNTWEEYNGVAYRVDDYFRAYRSVEESWKDHADLLLTKSWYAPYRAVMTDPVLGAWALRRSGYATDSQYPVKLIRIMKEYDLFKLDEFEL